ncbi:MAG: D-glycero-beta-D-manno-heptose-7-phosphate kinase [Acidobacteria bacterium]|nr:D-glycero-beta-D-manno-heptose-7-phosphate kinase [Acidobacteriota bacterium]
MPDLRGAIGRFRDRRILVIGDVMLDHFVVGQVERLSPEAPVPVVLFERDEFRIGGAANVAHNLRALGAQVELVGVIGADDREGERLRRELDQLGIADGGLVKDPDRRTTTKLRVVTRRNQQVARIDYESDAEIAGDVERRVIDEVARRLDPAAIVVVSDYLKGAVTALMMARLNDQARRRGVKVLVDPKIPHLAYYAGSSIITPNHHEAASATHLRIRTDEDAARAARSFRERTGCEAVLITRGEQGMTLCDETGETHLPASAREVADVTGAGDTVIAALALGLAAGATLVDAARLANYAASVAVGKFGPAAVTPAELLAAIEDAVV